MLTAVIKLADIAGRSLFVLIVLYSLPSRSSGQFGLTLTLIGLFSFLCGFERYVDLQRTLVGRTATETGQPILSVLRFFGFNYLLWLPILAALLYGWADLSALAIMLSLAIAIGEHLASESYRVALITHRHRSVMLVGMIKNIILLGIVSYGALTSHDPYDLEQLLTLWAALSIFGLLVSAVACVRSTPFSSPGLERQEPLSIFAQYKRSATHFKVGLLAILALQADRLVAGGLLSLEDSGIYFRHIFLAMSAYQVLGVISFNRVIAKVYSHLRNKDIQASKAVIRREQLTYLSLTLLMIALVLAGKLLPFSEHTAVQKLVPPYLVSLLFSYLIRGIADFNALVLNALYLEYKVFYAHLTTVALALALSLVLTSHLGLTGLMVTVFVSATIYLAITHVLASRALELLEDERAQAQIENHLTVTPITTEPVHEARPSDTDDLAKKIQGSSA